MGLSDTDRPDSFRRIGVFGGTFDPIHRGHLEIARFALQAGALDLVLMVPAGNPWLRSEPPVASAAYRLRMTEIAVANEDGIQVSDVDVVREGTTYTVDMLADLRETYGVHTELVLILGADAALRMDRWERPGELKTGCKVLVIGRPGESWPNTLPESHPARDAEYLEGPMLNVSATELRAGLAAGARLAGGSGIGDSVPTEVERYIRENGLYGLDGPGRETDMVQTASGADRLLGRAKELGALKFGDFTLTSGQKSTYYFDGRQLSLDPEGASIISQLFLDKITEAECVAAGGPTVAAVPIVGALMLKAWQEHADLTGFFVRPEKKGHGMGRQIEGSVTRGMKVAVFDDTVSTGGSLLEAIDAVQAFGCEIALVMCVLDRHQGGSDEVKRRGLPFVSFWEATPEGDVRITEQ